MRIKCPTTIEVLAYSKFLCVIFVKPSCQIHDLLLVEDMVHFKSDLLGYLCRCESLH